MRRVLMLAVLVSVLALPPVAGAQSSPFGPLPPADPPPVETPEPVEVDDGSLSITTLLLIGGAVIAVFVGIGMYITRDARSHLTDADRRSLELDRERDELTAEQRRRQSEAARRKARARAKAQRQARKKQRAR